MKTITLILIAAALGFAQSAPNPSGAAAKPSKTAEKPAKTTAEKPKTQLPRQATAAQKANPPVTTIPDGAKVVEPNLYRYTDPAGKTWMYRQTPFGISRWEDTPAAATAPAPVDASEPVAITDLGDSVRFEKKTAFGASKWVRKKSDLTDEEKALLAKQQSKAPARSETAPEKQ